jgi:hypothetical protein
MACDKACVAESGLFISLKKSASWRMEGEVSVRGDAAFMLVYPRVLSIFVESRLFDLSCKDEFKFDKTRQDSTAKRVQTPDAAQREVPTGAAYFELRKKL